MFFYLACESQSDTLGYTSNDTLTTSSAFCFSCLQREIVSVIKLLLVGECCELLSALELDSKKESHRNRQKNCEILKILLLFKTAPASAHFYLNILKHISDNYNSINHRNKFIVSRS